MGKLRGRCARLMVRLHFHQNGVPLAFQGTTVRSNRDYFTLILLIVAVWHFFVHKPDHIYLYFIVIPLFIYVVSKCYKHVDGNIKNEINGMIDSIMKNIH